MAVSCELVFLIISPCIEAAGPRVQASLREPVAKKGRQHQVHKLWVMMERQLCMEGVLEAREGILGACQIHQGALGCMLIWLYQP